MYDWLQQWIYIMALVYFFWSIRKDMQKDSGIKAPGIFFSSLIICGNFSFELFEDKFIEV